MQQFETDNFIPINIEGKQLDLSNTKILDDTDSAIILFQTACTRLRLPSIWHELGGSMTATFELATPGNIELYRVIERNDYLCIKILGPGNALGEGADWVIVEDIRNDIVLAKDESFGIRLRAASDPNTKEKDIAHFFKGNSSSTFVVTRDKNIIEISYHGRNELPNNNTSSVATNIRNTIIATGAIAGLSDLQWTALMKGLIDV